MSMSKFDWHSIRAMFEAGDSLGSIARNEGMPSKQAISVRAKKEGWTRLVDRRLTPARPSMPELAVIPFEGLSEEQRLIAAQIADGATQRLAAQMYGYHENTIADWKRENPRFAAALLAARAAKVKRRLAKIDTSDDWRAAGWLLERDVDSREDFIPPNASRGMTGTTFNVLGHVNLGFERLEDRAKEPALLESQ